jgi:hypothetical protein
MSDDFTLHLSQKTLRLPIYPDPVLQEMANLVDKFDKRLLSFSEQMLNFMAYKKNHGNKIKTRRRVLCL